MTALIDLVGYRFGRWRVLARASNCNGTARWLCRCDCGTEKDVSGVTLRQGQSKSCHHCARRGDPTVHGHARGGNRTKTYRCWEGMIARCCNPAKTNYSRYGGRGIAVCDRWRQSFQAFMDDMGPKPTGTTIERIDNDGHYEPGNCRWATHTEQQRNLRTNRLLTHKGHTACVAEWADHIGLNANTLRARLRLGWSTERALTEVTT